MAATDTGSPPLSSNTTLTVSVIDVNDNFPIFNATAYNFQVPENMPTGALVGVFEVADRDSGLAAENSFTLTGLGTTRFLVEIVNVTILSTVESQPPVVTVARIVASQALDREDIETYQLVLTAQDLTDQPLNASVPVNIAVVDANDNPPLFSQASYSFTISEGTSDLFIMEFTVSLNT